MPKKLDEIEKVVKIIYPLGDDFPEEKALRRKLQALVRKTEKNAFESGMRYATQNPQWRNFKPYYDQFKKGKP